MPLRTSGAAPQPRPRATAAEVLERFEVQQIQKKQGLDGSGRSGTAANKRLAPPLASLAAENPAVLRVGVRKEVESAVARELSRLGGRVANLERYPQFSRGLTPWKLTRSRWLAGSLL